MDTKLRYKGFTWCIYRVITYVASCDYRITIDVGRWWHRQNERKSDLPTRVLEEGLLLDVHGMVLAVTEAGDVFKGMVLLLFAASQAASETVFGGESVVKRLLKRRSELCERWCAA